LELALALEKPALPIAFTGGDSHTLWDANREEFIKALNLHPDLTGRLEGGHPLPEQVEDLAKEVGPGRL
jgi:hypothetical protein